MLRPGNERQRLARTLGAAYADGLLSQETFAHRIDQLLTTPVIEPLRFIGDLRLRSPDRTRRRAFVTARATARRIVKGAADDGPEPMLLALDWTGGQSELSIGRSLSCDVVLSDSSVSRHHVRLFYRDGKWLLHDLKSTNGTSVNGARVGRTELRPGDRLVLGNEQLRID
jgi:FHA domain